MGKIIDVGESSWDVVDNQMVEKLNEVNNWVVAKMDDAKEQTPPRIALGW